MEERVRRFLPMITTLPHPDMPEDSPNQFGAEVIVTLQDGRKVSRRIEQMVCRGGKLAMSNAELWEKFEDCGHRALPADMLAPLFERLETLESVTDIAQVTALLEPRRSPADAVAHASSQARAAASRPVAAKAAQAGAAWVP